MKLQFTSLILSVFIVTAVDSQTQDPLLSSSANYLRQVRLEAFSSPRDDERTIKQNRLFDLSGIIKSRCSRPGRKDDCLLDLCKIVNSEVTTRDAAGTYHDSWAKEPAGRQAGNFRWYGDFDQCINIAATNFSDGSAKIITPSYCYLSFMTIFENSSGPGDTSVMQYNIIPSYGACLPSTCTIERVAEIVNPTLLFLISRLEPLRSYCQNMDPPFDDHSYIAIACFSVVAFLLLCGLLVDISQRIRRSKRKEEVIVNEKTLKPLPPSQTSISSHFAGLLMCFSPLTNFEKLCAIPTPPPLSKIPNLSAINGIRTLSLFWVMLGHAYFLLFPYIDNLTTAGNLITYVTFQFVVAGYFAVDTFFFLSGYLAYWSLSRRMDANKFNFWLSLPVMYFHRFIRLTPALGAILLIDLGLWAHIGNGPFYFQGKDQNCNENWWAMLLYINNFVGVDKQCLGFTWYLSNDMQFFILVPFVAYFFVKKPVVGWIVSVLLLVVQIVSGATITVTENLGSSTITPPNYYQTLNGTEPKDYPGYYEDIYVKPYTRLGPYIVGVICCHLLVKHQTFLTRTLFKNGFLQFAGWVVSLGTMLAIIYGQHDVLTGDRLEERWLECLYNAFARTAWGVALGWIVLACAVNRGGLVGNILGWPFWAITARLSYAGYLLHSLVYFYYSQTIRRPINETDMTMIFLYLGTIFSTLIVSVPFSLAFESPIIGLTRGS